MNKNDYSVAPEAYLQRAREHLISGEAASLFYAALELRFFVESKQVKYLEAQAEYAKSIPKHWKIGAQGKALDAIFTRNEIPQISWSTKGKQLFEVRYVPLSPELRKIAERLGNLLHAQSKWIAPDDPWWDKTWQELRRAYELAYQCNRGEMLSPMLLVKGQAIGNLAIRMSSEYKDALLENMQKGAMGVFHVDYLSEPPEDWTSDLPE